MKQSTLVKLLAGGAACAVALSTAFAQDTSTTTTTAGSTGVSTTSTSTMSGAGTITAAPASDYIMFRMETSSEPVKYFYSKTTTVVDPEGKTVEISALRPDMPVTYTYMKDGDRMVITKVTLTKPLSYYEKKETTTTTTTTP